MELTGLSSERSVPRFLFLLPVGLVCLFLPWSLLRLLGLLLLSFSLPFLVFYLIRPQPQGYVVTGPTLHESVLPDHYLTSVCVDPELFKGSIETRGILHLPSGSYPAGRIRSLPDGVLMCAALAATWDTSDHAKELYELFPSMNLDPASFRSHFSYISSIEYAEMPGVVVRDGKGERAFFLFERRLTQPEEAAYDRTLVLETCTHLQDRGTTRPMEAEDRTKLQQLPMDTLLLLVADYAEGEVSQVTYLGALEIQLVQSLHPDAVHMQHVLSERGIELFSTSPMQPSGHALLPVDPIPVHPLEQHSVSFAKTAGSQTPLLSAILSMEGMLASLDRLRLLEVALLACLSLMLWRSGLGPIPTLSFLLIPLLAPVYLIRSAPRSLPVFSFLRHTLPSALVLAADLILQLILMNHSAPPLWPMTVLFHALTLALGMNWILFFLLRPSQASRRHRLILAICAFLLLGTVGASAYVLCGIRGIFQVLLSLLALLLILLLFGAGSKP